MIWTTLAATLTCSTCIEQYIRQPQNTPLSNAHGTFTKSGAILDHQNSLYKFQRLKSH